MRRIRGYSVSDANSKDERICLTCLQPVILHKGFECPATRVLTAGPLATNDWICPHCKTVNARHRSLCEGCAKVKPEDHRLTLDNDNQVFFYEQEFYVLSSFSAFTVVLWGHVFPTAEHAYHWGKFPHSLEKQAKIVDAPSAHAAFRLAQKWKEFRRGDWDEIKVDVMRAIVYAKTEQHEYVRRKLLETGERTLIENSWRDDFWGWGPNRDGKNMLGKLWMETRKRIQYGR